jgi:hypothetical protein
MVVMAVMPVMTVMASAASSQKHGSQKHAVIQHCGTVAVNTCRWPLMSMWVAFCVGPAEWVPMRVPLKI